MIKDPQIRAALRLRLAAGDARAAETGALLVEELSLCQGAARVDLAVIGDALDGFEIKSDADTLARLPLQQSVYNKTLDTVTLVTGRRHLAAALEAIPDWWGVIVADEDSPGVRLVTVRPARINSAVDAYAVLQLLWRAEAYAELERRDLLRRGMKTAPRRRLWRVLADHLTPEEASETVRRRLKTRIDWREGR